MPSVSVRQQEMMGADLARARAGKKTRTGMSIAQLQEFASTPRKGLPYSATGSKKKRANRRAAIATLRAGYGKQFALTRRNGIASVTKQ